MDIPKEEPMDHAAFKRLDTELDALFDARRYGEVDDLIAKHLPDFPELAFELNNYRLACFRARAELGTCLELLNASIEGGCFHGIYWKSWDALRSQPGYAAMERRNRRLLDRAQAEAMPRFELVEPTGLPTQARAPLALVFHGDGTGCNLDTMRGEWPADPYLRRGFRVAYLQSSRVVCTRGFGWTLDYARSRSEIHGMVQRIQESRAVDESCLVIGGYSGGAMISTNLLFNATFPVRGVIALCPDATGDENPAALSQAASQGTRAVILEGERSGEVPAQTALLEMLRQAALPHRFIRNPDVGHAIPLSMGLVLDEALDFILEA